MLPASVFQGKVLQETGCHATQNGAFRIARDEHTLRLGRSGSNSPQLRPANPWHDHLGDHRTDRALILITDCLGPSIPDCLLRPNLGPGWNRPTSELGKEGEIVVNEGERGIRA
jgi:hypothetical protein